MLKLANLARARGQYHVLIANINGIGDGFLALPLIRYIIELFGRNYVTVWGSKTYARTVYAELGEVFVPRLASNKHDDTYKERELAALQPRVTNAPLLCWVSLSTYWPRTVTEEFALAHLCPALIWDFKNPAIRRLRTNAPLLRRIDQYFRVIGEEALLPYIDRRPLIACEYSANANALKAAAHARSKRLIALHAETKSDKQWPIESWIQLIESVRPQAQFAILGRPAQPLAELAKNSADMWAPPDSWAAQVAVLAVADGFAGIDSCFAHIADACAIPGVVLFGTADIAQWGPRNPNLLAIPAPQKDLDRLPTDAVTPLLTAQVFPQNSPSDQALLSTYTRSRIAPSDSKTSNMRTEV